MAGWGNNSREPLPVGTHVHYINGGKEVMQKDFNDASKEVEKFEFDVQYQVEGTEEWKSRKIWTKRNFQPWESITAPNLIPALMKLVKACGLACPSTQAEAAAWGPDNLEGQYFRVRVEENEPEKYVTMEGVAPGPGSIGKGKAKTETPAAPPPPSGPGRAPAKTPPPPKAPPVPAEAAAAVTGADEYE